MRSTPHLLVLWHGAAWFTERSDIWYGQHNRWRRRLHLNSPTGWMNIIWSMGAWTTSLFLKEIWGLAAYEQIQFSFAHRWSLSFREWGKLTLELNLLPFGREMIQGDNPTDLLEHVRVEVVTSSSKDFRLLNLIGIDFVLSPNIS